MISMDPLSDMLIKIKNAGNAGKNSVTIPCSKLKLAIVNLLLREGYVASVNKRGRKEKKIIDIDILYENKKPKIKGLSRVSKVSRRIYLGTKDIRPVRQKHGDLILSTPLGILTGKDAKRKKVGGEALFKIW